MNAATYVIPCGKVSGRVTAPPSKSHRHRVLIADFLAGGTAYATAEAGDSQDVCATKRCLAALKGTDPAPVLDVGESGSTYRFMAPLAAALGRRPVYKTAGKLASRPQIVYENLAAGVHELPGNVSSQFVTGLLFALPLLADASEIRFTSPLLSRGYVDMTLDVVRDYGIRVDEETDGIAPVFKIPGGQTFVSPGEAPTEGDWSGAAFWLAMNALGSSVDVTGLDATSAQPDRRIVSLLAQEVGEKDVAQCPDIFPVLAVVAGARKGVTHFTGTKRLRIKECDRVAAMAEFLGKFGVATTVEEDSFTVEGLGRPFAGGVSIRTFGDHRIAMCAAVAATVATEPITIDDAACSAKSYPRFFEIFGALTRG